jgi:Mono-functional DNA-alkylating methyl methanesulfonate N-term
VPNWSPISECQLIGSLITEDDDAILSRSIDPFALTFPSEGRDRLYIGSGHRTQGAIKELRTGLKARVTVEFELEQFDFLFCFSNDSVRRIWVLTCQDSPQGENMEGYIVLSMTHNETKLLKWTSVTPRYDGKAWGGELEIDDFTAHLSTRISIAETTLAASLIGNYLIQITPSGIYTGDNLGRKFSDSERIVQASIMESDIAIVLCNETGTWNLMFMKALSNGENNVLSISPERTFGLPREPTTIKLVNCR